MDSPESTSRTGGEEAVARSVGGRKGGEAVEHRVADAVEEVDEEEDEEEDVEDDDDDEDEDEDEEADMDEEKKGTKIAHLSHEDYRIIVNWMETKANFEAIHGTGDKTKIGGKPKMKKLDAFQALVKHLRRKTTNKVLRKLSARNMQQRWRTYMRRFRKTLKASHTQTGMGLTRRELASGMSIQEKLEWKCPHFSRMKILFEMKANVTPFATIELGVPTSPTSPANTLRSPDANGVAQSNSADLATDHEHESWSSEELTFFPAAQSQMLPAATPIEPASAPSQAASEIVSRIASVAASVAASPAFPSSTLSSTASLSLQTAVPASSKQTGKRSSPASGKSKRSTGSKHQKTNQGTPNKPTGPTKAHESRMSLSAAYARNAEAKIDYLQQKLEEEHRQWNEKHASEKLRREVEAEQCVQEQKERNAQRKQELVLELLRQGKSMEDIDAFVQRFC